MIPAMGSYAHNDEDDLEVDFSHFELHPDKVTTNPLFESRSRDTSFFEDDGQSFQPRPGKRLPLPTKWSPSSPVSTPSKDSRFDGPEKGTPFSTRNNQMGSAYYPTPKGPSSPIGPPSVPVQNSLSGRERPPSPTDSISDHLTALMLAPSDTLRIHRDTERDVRHHMNSQKALYGTEPQQKQFYPSQMTSQIDVERNRQPFPPPHHGTYSLPPTPQFQDRSHHHSNPFHENNTRPPTPPKNYNGKYERSTVDQTFNSFNYKTVSHPPSPPNMYESAFKQPQGKHLPEHTSRSMNYRTAPRSLAAQRTNEATRRPMQYDRSEHDQRLYQSDNRTVPRPQTPPETHSMRSAPQFLPRDNEHPMVSKAALHQELLQSMGGPKRENTPLAQQRHTSESNPDNREHSKQHQRKNFTETKPYNQKGQHQQSSHHSRPAISHPKGDVVSHQKHAQMTGPPPPPMPTEQYRRKRSISCSDIDLQSVPDHRPRTQSVLTNGQSRHRREEIIRDFMPLDPKMPSVPLPDYEEESNCLYIPQPDY